MTLALADVDTRIRDARTKRDAVDVRIEDLRTTLGERRSAFIDASVDAQIRGNGAGKRANDLEKAVALIERDVADAERARDVLLRLEEDLEAQRADAERAELAARKAAFRERFVPLRARTITAIAEVRRADAAESMFADEVTRSGLNPIIDVMGQQIFGPILAMPGHLVDPLIELDRGLYSSAVDTLGLFSARVDDPNDKTPPWWADDRVIERLRKLTGGKQ